jgi:hypothetical protein
MLLLFSSNKIYLNIGRFLIIYNEKCTTMEPSTVLKFGVLPGHTNFLILGAAKHFLGPRWRPRLVFETQVAISFLGVGNGSLLTLK